MADPSTYRPKTEEIPTRPGVYRFRDERGEVIYVGKAKNLRSRLSNYFQDLSALHPRTQTMVKTACCVQWTVVGSEVEALTLEYSWIKEFNPRFNVMFKDDKSYPYFAVTMGEEFPRMQVTRGVRRKGTRYFGPFAQVWAIRQTLELLEPIFAVRSCSKGVFLAARAQNRPCLLADLNRCSAPCIGRITAQDHRQLAQNLCDFMAGKVGPIVRKLETEMWQASKDCNFELAARLRDNLAAVHKVLEKNAVVLPQGTDADVFALVTDDLHASVQVFHVRGGRIRGQRGWVAPREIQCARDQGQETSQADSEAQLMSTALEQIYGEIGEREQALGNKVLPRSVDDVAHTPTSAVPREVLVSHMPNGAKTIEQWLSILRGSSVSVRCPKRGAKKDLMVTVANNAQDSLRIYKTKRSSDLTHRNRALQDLGQALGIDPPLRIECYDISHTQGTFQVASMVVFEDGAPRKNAYRRFTVRGSDGNGCIDDTAAMSEVLTRRFHRLMSEDRDNAPIPASGQIGTQDAKLSLAKGIDPDTGVPRRFSYRPDLVVVDGGLPQVRAARRALDEAGAWDIPVVGLAKRLEEVWMPEDDFPVIFPRSSLALYLLQFLRDESHRFAITAHRKKRGKAMTSSILDRMPGLGAKRQRALLKTFGSVKKLREATVEELSQVEGIGPKLAKQLADFLAEN